MFLDFSRDSESASPSRKLYDMLSELGEAGQLGEGSWWHSPRRTMRKHSSGVVVSLVTGWGIVLFILFYLIPGGVKIIVTTASYC